MTYFNVKADSFKVSRLVCVGLFAAAIGNAMAAAPVTDANVSSTSTLRSNSNLSVEQRVERLERMLEARNQVLIELQAQVDDLTNTVYDVVGKNELQGNEIEQIVNRQRELYQEIDRRFSQLDSKPAAKPAVAQAAGEDQSYDAAVALVMKSKDYDAAIPAFESFLTSYPKSSYAPNAHYWLGQLHYTQGDREQAAKQFETVVSKYPGTAKVAESQLKLGIIAQHQGKNDVAKQLYQTVLKDSPNSSAAKLAKQRLDQL
ncbi:tol-pal system protein YbgF [Alginatibacterium sediminis]|uniref:Cell division coordinator CpoB n=1 Tax=Alginatibacterium sediminis TaxID=2164068 RepID=A0A420EG54_9ALTE|nr:tol-pal system protein YbgF [Alginatibacterium sediminis]RKF19691.1 tol-pal system protein YbgF [Alginatibacterium sediminis]